MDPQVESMPAPLSMADPVLPAPYRIERVRTESKETFTMDVAPVDGGDVPRFVPGQFNMVYVFGVGEVPMSICGDPGRQDHFTHTTRAVGVVTRAMHRLKRHDTLGLRGPYGTGWPVAAAEGHDVVIVAGGIGLAPLRPTLYHFFAHRERYGNLVLLYGVRTPNDMLYVSELKRWRKKFDLQIHLTVDHDSPEWEEDVGTVTQLITRAPVNTERAFAFICGPEIMMRYSAIELEKRGLPPSNLYISMERNMKCAVGFCGRCQFGPEFICKEGPVFRYDRVARLLELTEI